MLELKIITGMSGAGKTQMLRIMEDFGYYAIDHLPVELIADLIPLLSSEERNVEKAAIVVDIRENGHFHSFFHKQYSLLKNHFFFFLPNLAVSETM